MVGRIWGVLLLTVGVLALGVAAVSAFRSEPLPVPWPLAVAAFVLLAAGQLTAIGYVTAARRRAAEEPDDGFFLGLFPNRLAIVAALDALQRLVAGGLAFLLLAQGAAVLGTEMRFVRTARHG